MFQAYRARAIATDIAAASRQELTEINEKQTLPRIVEAVKENDDLVREEQKKLSYANLLRPHGGAGEVIYQWCTADKQEEFDESLIKQVDAHLDYETLKGVPVGEPVSKERTLPSRGLFVNKLANVGGWKASSRWIAGGHRDPDAGQYETNSPTTELLAHQLLLLLAAMFRWPV